MTEVFALAFDHRNSLRRDFMQLRADPTPDQHAAMVAAKGIVVDALLAAAPQVDTGSGAGGGTGGNAGGGTGGNAGGGAGGGTSSGTGDGAGSVVLLIDHEYGGGLVSKAQAGGIRVAMPVEVSGQRELRYLCDGHPDRIVVAHHPDYVKVLIRYNPGGDTAMNARQRARLRELTSWLGGQPQQLMLELLVPPEDAQLEAVADDRGRFDREVRAGLTVAAIGEIAGDGVRPQLWKIEGPESREDAARIAEAVHSAAPDSACLVLGRGADLAAVRRWLAIAAATAGFTGFAVGRTIWWDALRAYLGGGDRDAAVDAVAARYLELVRDYRTVSATT